MPRPARSSSLLVSLHDVGPGSESRIDRLCALLDPITGVNRYAMLVVPNHWGEAPIIAGSSFATRLRERAQAGAEIFLHGWYHRDESSHASTFDRWKAKRMTASEGEFLGLDYTTARQRMRDGRALLEDITGKQVAGFIAPAWLYGHDALSALADCGFALAEDHFRIWRPSDGRVIARSPVITWASRSRSRIASSLAVAAAARSLMPAHRGMRVAVHPGDTTVPALLRSIEQTVRALAGRAPVARYGDLLTDNSAPPASAISPWADANPSVRGGI